MNKEETNTLRPKDRRIFRQNRHASDSKGRTIPKSNQANMKMLQKIYVKYNPDHSYYCMCNKIRRKVFHEIFYTWFDRQRN